MVLMFVEARERSKDETSTKLLKCLQLFRDYPTFFRPSPQELN